MPKPDFIHCTLFLQDRGGSKLSLVRRRCPCVAASYDSIISMDI